MATLKSFLDAVIKYGSRNALPNPNSTAVDITFSSSGSATYTAPADGWLFVRAIVALELVVVTSGTTTQNYYSGATANVAFTVPVRKGTEVSVSYVVADYSGGYSSYCWGKFTPNN